MINALLSGYATLIENRINELYPETDEKFSEVINASRYSLLLGGKRIRPVLVLEFCKLCSGNTQAALDLAVALEFIHTYSLIHDDLPCMDNDDMRRGSPSCHIAYGESTALLAGDALLTEAFKIASGANISFENRIKAIDILAENAGVRGMIGGQEMDLMFEKTAPDTYELENMYLKKTGCLLVAAAKIGCIAAGADKVKIAAAEEYAKNLGLAFQIIDDILDAVGDEQTLGKPIGSDNKNNKTTFVSIYGIEKAREISAQLTSKAKSALECFKNDKESIYAITDLLLNRTY